MFTCFADKQWRMQKKIATVGQIIGNFSCRASDTRLDWVREPRDSFRMTNFSWNSILKFNSSVFRERLAFSVFVLSKWRRRVFGPIFSDDALLRFAPFIVGTHNRAATQPKSSDAVPNRPFVQRGRYWNGIDLRLLLYCSNSNFSVTLR